MKIAAEMSPPLWVNRFNYVRHGGWKVNLTFACYLQCLGFPSATRAGTLSVVPS